MNSITFFTYITDILSPTAILAVCIGLGIFSVIYCYTKKLSPFSVFNREKFAAFPNILKAIGIILKATFAAAVWVVIIKHIFKIPRPAEMLIVETGYSFPSGHAAISFAFFSAIAFCLYLFKNKKSGWLLLILAVLVSYSRVFLHVHRVVDVVTGAVLGLLCTLLVIKGYTWYIKKYAKV